ncbi:site-specific DNA-methyltransferase, partial [Fusobacterium sp. HMSC064B12]|uniref:site-specific DNA-methyltransferase n=1 Tax=Fusobacterium sp. HMSC064B12 TaxID=1739279 RepID=UPI000AF29B75
YHGKIKMIYIDPPYNTGKDFVYKDNFKDNIENYKKVTEQVSEEGAKLTTNTDSDGRYHSNWLNMMYPRLKLARNLLTDDGAIFISIDDNEVTNLKKMCDEIFGEENFVANFIRRTINSGKQDSLTASNYHEYLLTYSKNINKIKLNRREKSEEDRQKLYPLKDEHENTRGRYYISQLDKGSIQYSDSLNYMITAPDGTEIWPGKGFTDKTKVFRWSKEKVKWGIENDYIVFKKQLNGWKVYVKSYEYRDNNDNYVSPSNPYTTLDYVNKEFSNFNSSLELSKIFDKNKIFDFPKPILFIEDILKYSTNKNSLILDFFSGSATTAHSVMQLNVEDGGNRKYIMVQLPELCDENSEAYKAGYKNICEIGKERMRRAGEKIKLDESLPLENREKLDIGFKVFKLDSTNIKEWDTDTESLQQSLLDSIENIKSDRNSLDVLYEILLKYGLDLNIPIEENKDFYSIGGGSLLVSLNKEINNEVIDSICEEYKKLLEIDKDFKTTVILRDNSFKNDVDKTNAIKKLEQVGINEIRSI